MDDAEGDAEEATEEVEEVEEATNSDDEQALQWQLKPFYGKIHNKK